MMRHRSTLCALGLALLVAFAAVSTWEVYWRSQGYRPALIDDRDLWAIHRDRASGIDPQRHLTVIGASRIQLAFSVPAFEQAQPGWTATSLAINGHYPFAVLNDLANDPRFSGVVLCAVDARGLAHWYRDMSEPWVRHYHRDFGPQRRIERWLLSAVQQRLVVSGGEFNLVRRLLGWIEGRQPVRHYTRMLPDRTIAADFSMTDPTVLRRGFTQALAADYRKRPAPDPQRWREELRPVARAVARIRQRGGQVVFLRMPTADRHLELDQANYPREQYWDHLAEATGARSVHFADDPELAALELPDTSHIDQHDRARFTRRIVEILQRENVLPVPPRPSASGLDGAHDFGARRLGPMPAKHLDPLADLQVLVVSKEVADIAPAEPGQIIDRVDIFVQR